VDHGSRYWESYIPLETGRPFPGKKTKGKGEGERELGANFSGSRKTRDEMTLD